jgi:lipoprotein NlpD
MDKMVYLILMIAGFLLTACDDRETPAPVVESNWHALHTHQTKHRVKIGETLYAIAFRYDLDYRQLATINHVNPPYLLAVGQVLSLKPNAYFLKKAPPKPHSSSRLLSYKPHAIPSDYHSLRGWSWPARGHIVSSYVPQWGQKGIEISGHNRQAIRAALSGTVAYAGDGLPGYGNLILLQHNHQYLSAYAYNARNLVKVGQHVRAGQTIALMGTDNHHRYAVHFEIRKNGQPVNPKNYLPVIDKPHNIYSTTPSYKLEKII